MLKTLDLYYKILILTRGIIILWHEKINFYYKGRKSKMCCVGWLMFFQSVICSVLFTLTPARFMWWEWISISLSLSFTLENCRPRIHVVCNVQVNPHVCHILVFNFFFFFFVPCSWEHFVSQPQFRPKILFIFRVISSARGMWFTTWVFNIYRLIRVKVDSLFWKKW